MRIDGILGEILKCIVRAQTSCIVIRDINERNRVGCSRLAIRETEVKRCVANWRLNGRRENQQQSGDDAFCILLFSAPQILSLSTAGQSGYR